MTRFQMLLLSTGLTLSLSIGCSGLGDDDDDDAQHELTGGSYTVSNHTVTKDECDFAGVPGSLEISTPNGATGDVLLGAVGSNDSEKVELTRTNNNLTGFQEATVDNNPGFNCIEKDTENWDAVISAADTLSLTLTNYWETVTGQDTECMAANSISVWPCETIESFDMAK